jgi:hypothetical protein
MKVVDRSGVTSSFPVNAVAQGIERGHNHPLRMDLMWLYKHEFGSTTSMPVVR